MQIKKIHLLLIIILYFSVEKIHSSHLVGGEIYCDCLGPDIASPGNFQYQVNMRIYRDCHVGRAPFDDPAYLLRFNNQGVAVDTIFMFIDSIKNIPDYVNNPCLVAPPDVCVEAGYYSTIISIPGGVGDFTLSTQRCCRNGTIVNIIDPGSAGSTYTTVIKDPLVSNCNSSPRFVDFPPLVICENYPISFDHSATDPDNDSLVYELCTPLNGGSTLDPMPFASPPPYSEVLWKAGFDAESPLTANPPFSLSSTGLINGIPTALGQYVVGVCVKEYRNSVLYSTTFRDFQFNIANCDPKVVASIQDQQKFCEGFTFQMQNNSNGGSAYKWDFGVNEVLDDTSRLFEPIFIFPDTGLYNVSLIVNPGWPCADTSYKVYDVRDSLQAFFVTPEEQCLEGNSFQFNAAGKYRSHARFEWDFFGAASSSTHINPIISFQQSGVFPVKLTIFQDGCERSYSSTVEVVDNPISDFSFDDDSACVPFEVNFTSKAKFVDDASYTWFFGDGNTAQGANAHYIYHTPGTYDVGLLVENKGKCMDSSLMVLEKAITVLPLPKAKFEVNKKELSKFDADITIRDASSNAVQVEYYIMNGIHLVGPDHLFHFPDTGNYAIMQISYNLFGCSDTSILNVYVYDEFHIYIPNAFTPNKDGLNEVFLPVVSGVGEYLFQVFSKWGELIFETTDPKEGWNGRKNGILSQFDSYVYRIEAEDLLGNEHSYKGTVNLLR